MKTEQTPRPKGKALKSGQYKSVDAFRKTKLQEAVEETKHIDWDKASAKPVY